jgi:hypothetical protein
MLAFSIDYYGIFFGATQSVELFCTYEMKNLQDTLFEKEKNSKRQDVLTIVGLVLSVLFGIMTFIQFFI